MKFNFVDVKYCVCACVCACVYNGYNAAGSEDPDEMPRLPSSCIWWWQVMSDDVVGCVHSFSPTMLDNLLNI